MGNYVSLLCVCVRHDTFTYAQESEKEDNLKRDLLWTTHRGCEEGRKPAQQPPTQVRCSRFKNESDNIEKEAPPATHTHPKVTAAHTCTPKT